MTTTTPKTDWEFLQALTGLSEEQQAEEELEQSRNLIAEQLRTEFKPDDKERLRKAFTFDLVDSKGKRRESSFAETQEGAIDTFGSVKRGHGIAEEDWPRVQKAFGEIVEMTSSAIEKYEKLRHPKDKNRPAYDLSTKQGREKFSSLIEQEVFTPLVREKILPETFVPDAYSEVQKLLNATFANYRQTLKESLQEELDELAMDVAETEMRNSRISRALLKRRQKTEVERGTKESEKRKELGYEIAKGVYRGRKALKALKNMIPDEEFGGMSKTVMKQDRFLNPEAYKDNPRWKLNDERQAELGNSEDPDDLRLEQDQQFRENKMVHYADRLSERLERVGLENVELEGVAKDICAIIELKETDPGFYTMSAAQLVATLVEGGVKIGKSLYTIHELNKEKKERLLAVLNELASEDKMLVVVNQLLKKVGEQIVAGIKSGVNPGAGEVLDGMFADEINERTVREAALKGDSKTMIALIAAAMKSMFANAAPSNIETLEKPFTQAGSAASKAFQQTCPTPSAEAIQEDPEKAFAEFPGAANAAVFASVGDLKPLLANPKMLLAVASKTEVEDEEAQLEQLEREEEELRDFENKLTLIDENGLSQAEQRSIETLIAKLKKDNETLKIVNEAAKSLTGLATTSTNIGAWATEELTDVVSGQIGSALKAAKLIVKLAVNIKASIDRWRLFFKFRKNLERSKRAVSSLSTTIQGFMNNKAEQCAFHEAENALTFIQIAAAVLGTVPEPVTMAVGKTLGKVTKAMESALTISQMIYDQHKLAEAWKVTKNAMDNPSDRGLGLQALRLNPTLGMHALAWAAIEKQPPDPIARMMFNSLGISEETLATGAKEKDLRRYLTELLDEDRKLDSVSHIETKLDVAWAPDKPELMLKSFCTTVTRGQRDAVPALRRSDEKSVMAAFKAVANHDLTALAKQAELGQIEISDAERLVGEAEALWKALNSYTPCNATDDKAHVEMTEIADAYIALAKKHRDTILEIELVNATKRNPVRAKNDLSNGIERLEKLFGPAGAGPVRVESIDYDHVEKSVSEIREKFQQIGSMAAFKDDNDIGDLLLALQKLLEVATKWCKKNRVN